MTFRLRAFVLAQLLAGWVAADSLAAEKIERIWLTHANSDPRTLTVQWETSAAGDSIVEYGLHAALGQRVAQQKNATLHAVKIPLEHRDAVYHYRVRSGDAASEIATFKAYPTEELRVAVVGDWGFAMEKDLTALAREDVHLLLTAGDNVPHLHGKGREGMKAFSALIDSQPALFRSTPFMPILGNHDRELTPRGSAPPAHAVYDVSAAAYREFFALPGEEWKWHFDLPDFDVRFIALDLNHISDHGTTWQTCHAFDADSDQFHWYVETMAQTQAAFVFTLMNEKQTQVHGRTKGLWHEHFRKGSALITGFGYFADRALLAGGLHYFNTCLKGDGAPYKDPQSQFFAQEDNYLLLTFRRGAPHVRVQIKSLRGEVLDTVEIQRRR